MHASTATSRNAARLATAGTALLLAASGVAWAGPKEEVEAATKKMLAAKSWHADMTSSGGPGGSMTTGADFVAPDRYRLKTPQGTQLIIGDTMHMTVAGRSMAVPLPKGSLSQWRDPAKLADASAKTTVTALGSDPVGGKPAKKYETRNADHPGQVVVMWVGAAGYPVKIRTTSTHQGRPVTTDITYSRFNDPALKIAAP